MRAREWSKPLIVGAVIGAVLFAAGLGFLVFRQRAAASQVMPARVAVIVVSRDASDAPTAQGIAIVQNGTLRFVSPETAVTVPGTSSRRLADAYSFGGGALVASLLPAPFAVEPGAYIAIPEQVWLSAVGGRGVDIELPEPVEVFDGERLVSLSAGRQVLDGTEAAALLRAIPYLGADRRDAIRESLVRGILAAVGRTPSAPGIESGLPERDVRRALGSL